MNPRDKKAGAKPASRGEVETTLDPERAGEERAVAAETADRLRGRGVDVRGTDTAADLANLLTAVEQFEALVERRGGDLMVDDLKSSQPDDAHFVLPRRKDRETVRAYIDRIQDATARLQRHPPHVD